MTRNNPVIHCLEALLADPMHLRWRPAGVALGVAATALVGCSEPDERQPLPSWVENQATLDDTDDPDAPDPSALGTFTLVAPTRNEIGWGVTLHAEGDFDEPCTLEVPDDYRDQVELDCILEIPELNLYAGGLDFNLSVAPSQCAFLAWAHPMYQSWPIGQGPDEVWMMVRHDGVILDEINSLNGAPKCDYDHSWTHHQGPNCCYGPYTFSVVNPAGEYLTKPETRFWDGDLSECFGGAAHLDPERINDFDGFPVAKVVHIERTGFNKAFHWDGIAERGYRTNVPLASYFDPANHDGVAPRGFLHPLSMPDHRFLCLDEAEETLATIRLKVREWNSVEEFEKGAQGDPNVQGTEPNGTPIDDRPDWGVATPGSEDFIMDGE